MTFDALPVNIVTAEATHPEWVLLDDDGHPVLDENNEPVRKGDKEETP